MCGNRIWKLNIKKGRNIGIKKTGKKFPWKMCRMNSSLIYKHGRGLNVTPFPFFVFRFYLFSVIDSGTLMAFYWSSAAHTSTLRQKPWTNEHYYRFLALILSNMSNGDILNHCCVVLSGDLLHLPSVFTKSSLSAHLIAMIFFFIKTLDLTEIMFWIMCSLASGE